MKLCLFLMIASVSDKLVVRRYDQTSDTTSLTCTFFNQYIKDAALNCNGMKRRTDLNDLNTDERGG